MSKELEALDRILEAYNDLLYKYNLGGGLGNNYLTVKKALTSPTSEEVCKALSEHFRQDVLYNTERNFFHSYSIYGYVLGLKNGAIRFNHELPPHLTILVGRFYEGVIENE